MDLSKKKNCCESEIYSEQLQKEIGYHLKRSYIQVIEQFHLDMGEFKLSPGEYSILCIIQENDLMTAKKLSKELNIAPPNLVNLIDRLESRQIIIKTVNSNDRRSQILKLSKFGEGLLQGAMIASNNSQNRALSKLSETEREQLIKLLKKIYSKDSTLRS